MSSTLEQIPVRLSFSPVSDPPNAPIDANTGLAAAWWRGGAVALQCGIFGADGSCVDLSNATAVQLVIQNSPTDPEVLLNTALLTDSILPVISAAEWASGEAQQFTFALLNGETDFDLGGEESAQFWLSLRVYTGPSTFLIYGAGYVTIFNPGAALPIATPAFVSLHAQTNSTGNSTISPTTIVHTEQVTITGVAGTRNLLVSTTGLPAGARVDIAVVFNTAANNIVINARTSTIGGTLLFTFTRSASETNLLLRLVADGAGGFATTGMVVYPTPVIAGSGVDATITSYADLAALSTVGLTPPVIKVWILTAETTVQVWRLLAGTDATVSGSIQRPDDYNASTNAKVWYRAG
jgi:hypothetical protein